MAPSGPGMFFFSLRAPRHSEEEDNATRRWDGALTSLGSCDTMRNGTSHAWVPPQIPEIPKHLSVQCVPS